MSIRKPRSVALWAGVVFFSLTLAACGGSSSSSSTGSTGSTGQTGTPASTDCTQPTGSDSQGCTYVNLTDAPGDFLSYTVQVTALTLTRSDGTVVNILPAATTVDFAQYTDLNEFLTLAAMPLGAYSKGSITLDYTNADIEADDAGGNAVKLAPVDGNGNPITTLTLAIQLDSSGNLVLVPGVPKLFQVDFDLAASNSVDLSNDTVTVQPFLSASVDPNLDNQTAVRGPLSSVDTANGDFTLGLRPFYATTGSYGPLRVFVGSSTVYNINQTAYSGSAGLAALAAAGATTAVVAQGSYDFSTHQFDATEVDAGSSVPGGTLDAAEGVVLSRSGDSLVLRGSTLYRAGQTASFADTVSVTLGSGTKVHEAGSPSGSFDISDISVGQRLLVFGTLTDTNPSALALDASSGYARLDYTRFDGTVVTAPASGSMTVDVQFIEGRPVSLFNFAGTGATAADPSNYVVSFASTPSGINVNDPVRVWGFVTPFGSAPPDFTGTSVADYASARSLMSVTYASPGSTDAFSSLSSSGGLVLNLSATPTPAPYVEQGGIVTTLTGAPVITGSVGVYAIVQNGTVTLHITLAGFLSDLTTRLGAGGAVRAVFARGGYAGGSETLTAGSMAVILQ